jgi:hypothetical protein
MNYSGVVRAINLGGTILHSFTYVNREERRLTIDRWRRIYSEMELPISISILPDTLPERKEIKEVSLERIRRLQRKSIDRQDRIKEKQVVLRPRPIAKYDNAPIYDYEKTIRK